MKVSIGPYRYSWVSSVYVRHMNDKYDHMCIDSKDWQDVVWEKLDGALQWLYDNTINLYLTKRQRKIKVEIDEYDVWSMDHTLAYIILPMLRKIEKNKQGAPFVDDEDVPEELRSTNAKPKENDWDDDSNHFKRWDYVLSEIIWTFEMKIKDGWESDFYSGSHDVQFVKRDDSDLFEMVSGPKDTFEIDHDGIKKTQERIDNGFRLFGRYYESLWV